jgi:hypothetical protein
MNEGFANGDAESFFFHFTFSLSFMGTECVEVKLHSPQWLLFGQTGNMEF